MAVAKGNKHFMIFISFVLIQQGQRWLFQGPKQDSVIPLSGKRNGKHSRKLAFDLESLDIADWRGKSSILKRHYFAFSPKFQHIFEEMESCFKLQKSEVVWGQDFAMGYSLKWRETIYCPSISSTGILSGFEGIWKNSDWTETGIFRESQCNSARSVEISISFSKLVVSAIINFLNFV